MQKRAIKETYSILETFVRLGRRVPGVLYEPDGLADKAVPAVLVMHSDARVSRTVRQCNDQGGHVLFSAG